MTFVKRIVFLAAIGLCLGIFGCTNSPAQDPYAKLLPQFNNSTPDWSKAPLGFKRQLVHHSDGAWTFRGYVVHPPKGFNVAS